MGQHRFDAVIIGAGQAGLSTAYELSRRGVSCVALDAEPRIGNQWRRRWDSLRLFTPARVDRLPGSRFPAPDMAYPTKDEFADYLESYAADARIPIRAGVRATAITRTGETYRIETTDGMYESAHVVVATGYDKPTIPAFATELTPSIRQLHASEYRNATQLSGDVLVVGAGTSGVEIAVEAAAAGHETMLAGKGTGEIPPAVYAFGGRLFWWYATRIASLDTPIGRAMYKKVGGHGAPLIRLKMADALAVGVKRAPRVRSVERGFPKLEDGKLIRPQTIVWCTGFGHDFSWIKVPNLQHERGVVVGESGLYFVGLFFQTRLASTFVGGVGIDARYVAEAIASRVAVGDNARKDVARQQADPLAV